MSFFPTAEEVIPRIRCAFLLRVLGERSVVYLSVKSDSCLHCILFFWRLHAFRDGCMYVRGIIRMETRTALPVRWGDGGVNGREAMADE